MPNESIKYVVLTEGGLSAGATVAYLLDNTSARISKIFVESGYQPPRPSQQAASKRGSKSKKLQRMRLHAGLARRQPRKYFFQVLQRLTGWSQERLLERVAKYPSLVRLVCGFPIPRELRDGLQLKNLHRVAEERNIPLVTVNDFNGLEALELIEAESPDIILGLGTRILKSDLLRIPSIGSLNGHASLLPEYRGGVTEFWQLVHGETCTGVTIHWMVPDVDAGDICTTGSWAIPHGYDHHKLRLLSLFNRLEPWREVVARLEAGELPRTPQSESQTPVFRKPTLQMEYDFYCRRIPIEPRVMKPKAAAAGV